MFIREGRPIHQIRGVRLRLNYLSLTFGQEPINFGSFAAQSSR